MTSRARSSFKTPSSEMSSTATSFQVILIIENDERSETSLFFVWPQTRSGPKYQFSS
jgi:hypothetical protein